MYVFIALFITLFCELGVFCSGKCFSPDIFIVSVRHFKGKRVVGGWVVGLAIGVIGHEEVRRLLLISVQDKWEHSLSEVEAHGTRPALKRPWRLRGKCGPAVPPRFPPFTKEVGIRRGFHYSE